jgi:hypothetical protein
VEVPVHYPVTAIEGNNLKQYCGVRKIDGIVYRWSFSYLFTGKLHNAIGKDTATNHYIKRMAHTTPGYI